MVASLPKIAYKLIKVDEVSECSICLNNFEDEDLITPLSCDIRHYFHHACIKEWMVKKNECPLCKDPIQPASLKQLSKELKSLVPEYQKINGSRMIAPYLNLENTRSRSFYHFISSIKKSSYIL